jgi:type VI secretion system protein ImpC
VDRDNRDQLIVRLGVKLNVSLPNDSSQSLSITFNDLDDFHPDRLYNRLEIFDSLRRTRARLKNSNTFAEAAVEVREWEELSPAEAAPPKSKPVTIPEEKPAVGQVFEDNLLDRILTGSGDTAPATKLSQPTEAVSAEIAELAQAAVKPYLTPDIEPYQDQLLAAVDARIAGTMNAILHHPDFQALESAWRALNLMVSRLETGTDLKLYLLDVSCDEFRSDLKAGDDFRLTALYRLLVEDTVRTPGGVPWSVIAGNYTFDFTASDLALIEPISMIAQESGASFVAGVTSHFLGCDSLVATPDPDDWQLPLDAAVEDLWKRITSLPSAAYVGFALPRFLLRLPYGKDTEPIEEFDFEEMNSRQDVSARHGSYLWANPSFAVAFLLAKGFSADGWGFRPSDHLQIEGLPLHVYEHGGDSEIKPCAEVLLTLRAAEKIIDRGLMPLLSMKHSDIIRLGMLQSISGAPIGRRRGGERNNY